jgi:hypothetical protein
MTELRAYGSELVIEIWSLVIIDSRLLTLFLVLFRFEFVLFLLVIL